MLTMDLRDGARRARSSRALKNGIPRRLRGARGIFTIRATIDNELAGNAEINVSRTRRLNERGEMSPMFESKPSYIEMKKKK